MPARAADLPPHQNAVTTPAPHPSMRDSVCPTTAHLQKLRLFIIVAMLNIQQSRLKGAHFQAAS